MQENNFNARLNLKVNKPRKTRLTLDLTEDELKRLDAIKKKFNIKSYNQALREMIDAIFDQNIHSGDFNEN